MVIIGIGNILQNDDGFGVYASTYLQQNYKIANVQVINGGVDGIKLLDIFINNKNILILDTIQINDNAGSIYLIPANELNGYGINSGSAHEIGVLQCLDIMELQGYELPNVNILGIIPKALEEFTIQLSQTLIHEFDVYITNVLKFLDKNRLEYSKINNIPLEQIINNTTKETR